MTKNDCFLYYIIATKLDGTKEVHTFKNVIGAQCSYKYVNMMGKIIDLSKFTNRTPHVESSSDPALGNIIHETREIRDPSSNCSGSLSTNCVALFDKNTCNNSYIMLDGSNNYQCNWMDYDCKTIDSSMATDSWCNANCNAVTPFCPNNLCQCTPMNACIMGGFCGNS